MSDTQKKVAPYKEVLKETLYEKDYINTSDDGREFPKNRITVWLYDYSWEYEDFKTKEVKEYNWQKVKITNAKLVSNKWNTEVAKKVLNWKAYDDANICILSSDDFAEMLTHFKK